VYFDEPKPLAELIHLVSRPRKGYDIHHIVEQTPARKDGFPQDIIQNQMNKVRIPTFQHHEITG
jgi:hypothetical protein